MQLAHRLSQITPSATLAITTKAKAMKAQGITVYDFSAGEPDFDTPEHIKAAAKSALDAGKTKYGPIAGIPELRQGIVAKLAQEQHLTYGIEQVMVTNGGKQSLYNFMMAFLNPGDQVLIPSPYWVSYPEMVRLGGAEPVFLPTSWQQDYKITPSQLAAAITDRTKLLIFNSPANPTGSVYSPEEVQSLAAVLQEHPQVWVISDEIYEKIIYDQTTHVSIATHLPDRTVISSGFAKAYAMTGWRIGYLVGNEEIIKAACKLQGHSTSNVCTFAQYGALQALQDSQACVESMRRSFADRRELMSTLLRAIPALECPKPKGAFYMFPDISRLGVSSVSFCQALLEEVHVAIVPGLAFGTDQCVRLSYAAHPDTITQGCQKLQDFIQHHYTQQ